MKIYRKAFALPLNKKPIEYGGRSIDFLLSEKEADMIEKRFKLKDSVGEGMWGMAFLTEDDKVLKLTLDDDEYKAALQIKDAQSGAFAKIYDLGELYNENGYRYYYILKEKVYPLNDTLRMVFNKYEDNQSHEEQKDLKAQFPVAFEIVETYYDKMAPFHYEDLYRHDNVGLNSSGEIVSFDARMGYN